MDGVTFAIAAHAQCDAFEGAEVAGCRVRTDARETTIVLESNAAREFQRAVLNRKSAARDATHDGIVTDEPIVTCRVELEDAGSARGGHHYQQAHDQGLFHGSRLRVLRPRDCAAKQ